MKYALVNGVRQDAQPKLRGACINCGREMIAKCGEQRIWHWSHQGKLECDHWWEPETEWHRRWKNLFPKEWQEVPHVADNGERHIADVKTASGWVVELQHSPISSEERMSRETFYQPMVWVADGLRYKRDLTAFRRAVAEARIVKDDPLYLEPLVEGVGIFQRWAPRQRPVFIDFGDEEFHFAGYPIDVPVLWQLLLRPGSLTTIIAAVTRDSFVQFCHTGSPLRNLTVFRGPQRPTQTHPRPLRHRHQLPA